MNSIRSALLALIVLAAGSFAGGLLAAGRLTIGLLSGHTPRAQGHLFYFGAVFIAFVLPALLYVFIAFHLNRRRPWAGILGIVIATIHATCGLLVVIATTVVANRLHGFVFVPAVAAFVLMSGALITARRCWMALRELHELHPDDPGAFAPLMHDKPPEPDHPT